jgi:hypothetical protein
MNRWSFLGIALALAAALPLDAAAGDPPLSAAQIALFESSHLKSIQDPTVVRYRFEGTAGAERFTDGVAVGIEPRPDGTKDVRVAFLSGDRHMPFNPAIGFNGNPVLMFFLEHDVAEMQKATGGSRTYFRNRIREAFVDKAEVRSISLSFGGKDEPATEITLAPFRHDPMIARFERFREKSYRFVLADAVPGTIYQIATVVPASGSASDASGDTMTFTGTAACQGSDGCAPDLSSR